MRIEAWIGIELDPQGEKRLGGGPVRPVHHQTPIARPRASGNGIAVLRKTRNIVLPECFRLADAQPRLRIDIDKFGIAGEGKSLLDRIGDHDKVPARAAYRNALDRGRNFRRISEKVADQNSLGTASQAYLRGKF